MAIPFSELVDPNTLTVELAILLMTYIFTIAYIGIRLRAPSIFTFWSFSIIILIFTFVTPLDFIWFWGMAMLTVLVVAFVSIIKELI